MSMSLSDALRDQGKCTAWGSRHGQACLLTCSTGQTPAALRESSHHAQYSPLHSARGALWSLGDETVPRRHPPSQWRSKRRASRSAQGRNTGMNRRPHYASLRTAGAKWTDQTLRSSYNQSKRSSVSSARGQAGQSHPFLSRRAALILRSGASNVPGY
jgi:hypothetical protein